MMLSMEQLKEYLSELNQPISDGKVNVDPRNIPELAEPIEIVERLIKFEQAKALTEKALDSACLELSDHQCPYDYDLVDWDECANCKQQESYSRYDGNKDFDCTKKHFLEVAEKALEEIDG